MSISLNNVNSEVVRAHKRVDNINITALSSDNKYFTPLYLMKLSGNTGVVFGGKFSAFRNYIETSDYFSSVKAVIICPWIDHNDDGNPKTYNYIVNYQNVINRTTVLYNAWLSINSGPFELKYSSTKSEDRFASCSFLIVGTLK